MHTYDLSGWTWEHFIQNGKAALAIDLEDDARIVSTDKKAVKAGGLYLALNGVAVKPTDDVDADYLPCRTDVGDCSYLCTRLV